MKSNSSRFAPLLWAVVTLVIVGGVGVAGYRKLNVLVTDTPAGLMAATTTPARVIVGQDYFVFVRLVELNAVPPGGGRWDSGGGSAPDPYVLLFWKGNRLFDTAVRSDQLIATWDLFRVDVKDLITSGGKIDIASSLNAPILRVEENTPLTLEVWDEDPAGDDLALKTDINLDTLKPGENVITPPDGSGVRRIIIQMIDRQTPLAKLIEMAGER